MQKDKERFIYKIFDTDCPVCAEMVGTEINITEEFHIQFPRISLDQCMHYKEVFNYISLEVAEDGSVDLPIYLQINEAGVPTAHLCGKQSTESLLKLCKSLP